MADNIGGAYPNRGKTDNATASPTQSVGKEGFECDFNDNVDGANQPDTVRSGRVTRCRLVRNVSTIALQPKMLVSWASGFRGRRVDGYVNTTAGEAAGVVDDQLSSAGAPVNSLFWIMRKGPGLCLNDVAQAAGSAIALDAQLGALTAAASTGTTAGRVYPQALTGLTSVLAGQINNTIGRAMTARLSNATNSDVLVDLDLLP